MQTVQPTRTPVKAIYKWIAAASVAALLITISALYLNSGRPQKDAWVKLSNQSGKPSAYTLPDGSAVWLNAESSLSYSGNFTSDRQLKLTGEAFFNVVPDKKAPFIVHAGGIATTVLGTSFNIKAYASEKVTVSVATGKVHVAQEGNPAAKPVLLTASQQTSFDKVNGLLPPVTLAVNDTKAWTQNRLVFHNMPLSEVVAVLERWYGISITIKSPLLEQCKVEGEYRQASLTEVLNTLQFALGFTYKQLPGGILIEGKGCKPAG